MTTDPRLSLARKIHGSALAGPDSFSASQWAGVERAWEWIEKQYHPQEPPMKQDHGCRGCNDPAYLHTPGCIAKTTPPWTAEQREAAYSVAHHAIALSVDGALCATDPTTRGDAFMHEITRVAPLFVEQRAVPMAERALHTAHEFTPHGINLSATCGTQGQIDAIPWSDILRHAPKRAVPSIEACVEAFESLCYDHESKRDRRAGVESVRALCIGEQGDGRSVEELANSPVAPQPPSAPRGEGSGDSAGSSPAARPSPPHILEVVNSSPLAREVFMHGSWAGKEQGDGASVPGDSGLKAGHNMERGSGCPASDHHADRETSTPQGPKDPAPSPAPAAPKRDSMEHSLDALPYVDAYKRQVDELNRDTPKLAAPFAPDREALAKAMQLALAKHPNEAVAPLHDCRLDIVDLRYRQADAALTALAPLLAERDALQAEVEKLRRERDGWMPLNRRLIEHRIEAEKERDTALARVRELEEASKIASDVYAAAQKVGEHLARTTGVVLAGKTYDHAVNAALDRIKELEGAGIDVDACAREIDAASVPWQEPDSWKDIASILRKHARPANRSVTREELATIVYNYEISEKPMTAALASVGIEVKP